MKYTLSGRHSLIELTDIEEIKLDYENLDRIRDFISDKEGENQKRTFYIYIKRDTKNIDWQKLSTFSQIFSIYIIAEEVNTLIQAHNQEFNIIWAYPVTTYWELRSLLELKVSQIYIGGPLFFSLPKVKNICGQVEIRIIANKCLSHLLPQKNGICGTYIRPEDIQEYEPYVDHIEFYTTTLQEEITMYKIYAINKTWNGNLNFLFKDLNYNIDNRLFETLPTENEDSKMFAHRRLTCEQKCQKTPELCNFCISCFNLITSIDKNQDYLNKQLKSLS